MISANSIRFEYIKRNHKGPVVFVPGWATDIRIFKPLDLNFDYLLPVDFSPFAFGKGLPGALRKNGIKKVSLFGWSLGGFAAAEFACRYKDIIDELILVSIRRKYPKEEIVSVKKNLKRNKKGYLRKFYSQCFSKRERMRWFRESLLEDYCEKFDLDYLLHTLDYLKDAEIKPDLLKGVEKIKIIHGELDMIAPIQEAVEIKSALPQARFIPIKNEGHIPFLKEDFNKWI